ncbi:MAG: phospholipid carrier-dependent glycosyltransferase [Candidatus Yanofskybacteria bacterium]|nr:phospholipid carrier-dependent glycosyltransferase [Candidatus Yanofskybacteria bacterium]
MLENKKTLVFVLIILALSIFTHFIRFGHPNQTVFDEVHFGKFLSGYFTGEYFFDIHPPLGKLLLSATGYVSGFKPGFSFANIGEMFPDKHYLALRLLPIMAGTLLPLVVFFLALRLGFSKKTSLLTSLFIVFENALLVQSRFILLDSMLLLFGFGSLLAYLKYRSGQSLKLLLLAGVLAGLSASVKWTGLGFLGLIIIFQLFGWLEQKKINLKETCLNFTCLILLPFVIYLGIFAIHFKLLPKSGPGNAFMTPSFQKTLLNNQYGNDPSVKPIGFFKKFTELNMQMYGSNKRLIAAHPYGSKWYSWPFMSRTIYYWNKAEGQNESKVYFLGNPFIWWSSSIAVLYLLLNSASKLKKMQLDFPSAFILSGFFLNLLPFIGVGRVMFLYHYFTSLVFAILALGYLLNQKNKKGLFGLFLFFSILFFLFFSPFTYGLPLTVPEQNLLFWLSTWR